ncbi:AsmA family protein [Motilimonas pumila]|uniref:AsmA family protein n=1 Tax=Motilimonas pumila TaxID=2303987 RepID=A0A418YCI1_9GAMM|nr:AsmA family protein [Motilimonas pumila]RJG42239.1 AsmA family protein [Motilimonas pumila]
MKKLLYVVAGLAGLFVVAAVVITRLVDTERVKLLLIAEVEQATGAELVIEGDLSWQFFPRLGFELGQTELRNPAGFSEPNFASFDKASMDVALMPLLDKQVEIGELVLTGASVNILTNKKGLSNLEMLTSKEQENAAQTEQGEQTSAGAAGQDIAISLAGIRIENGQLLIRDEKTQQQQQVSNMRLLVAAFTPGERVPVTLGADYATEGLAARLESQFNLLLSKQFDSIAITEMVTELDVAGDSIVEGQQVIGLKGDLTYDVAKQQAKFENFVLSALEHEFTGSASVVHSAIPVIRYQLNAKTLDLDAILAKVNGVDDSQKSADSSASNQASQPPQEPDLSALKTLDLKGKMQVDEVKVANATVTQVGFTTQIKQGVAKLSDVSAQLYQGTLKASAELNANQQPATFKFKQQLAGVQARPLLTDVAELDMLAGAMKANINLSGQGLSELRIRQTLAGKASFEFSDGALYGVNIPLMVRKGQAQLKGKGGNFKGEEKTDFSALSGTFNVGKGKASTKDLHLTSPLIRVKGTGHTDLVAEALDFKVNVNVVGSLKGQGGKSEQELAGLDIPLMITGTWQQPKYTLDMEALMAGELKKESEKVKQKVEKELSKKLGDETSKELLKQLPLDGLFN